MMRRLTIHSDGTSQGTVVLDEDGNEIQGITDLDFRVTTDDLNEITLEIRAVSANVQGDLRLIVFECPVCNHRHDHICDKP